MSVPVRAEDLRQLLVASAIFGNEWFDADPMTDTEVYEKMDHYGITSDSLMEASRNIKNLMYYLEGVTDARRE